MEYLKFDKLKDVNLSLPIVIEPVLGSQKRKSKCITDDFPLPLGPIIAIDSPSLIRMLMFLRTMTLGLVG